MSDTYQRRGFLGFMSTIPGILTAIAAVVTSAGGIYLDVHKSVEASPAARVTVNLPAQTQSSPPPTNTDIGQQSVQLGNASRESIADGSGDASDELIAQCGQGDQSACETILEYLIEGCTDGNGTSCDVLYEISPAGSDLEQYGATCGDRLTADYAGTCEDQ